MGPNLLASETSLFWSTSCLQEGQSLVWNQGQLYRLVTHYDKEREWEIHQVFTIWVGYHNLGQARVSWGLPWWEGGWCHSPLSVKSNRELGPTGNARCALL